ncbi:MAG: hypothetical protein Q4G68_07235 [Planctomycetia bacterium]|nr:hypothetical protein [Planctomycetia bacterium]
MNEQMNEQEKQISGCGAFLGTQFAVAGLLNVVCNGLAFWLSHRDMNPVHYGEIASDAVVTCVCITFLVVFPTSYFTRKAMESGQQQPISSAWSARLPDKEGPWWLLCLTVALVVVEFLIAVAFLLYSEWSFCSMLGLHCLWCGILGGVCGLLTAWRCLVLVGPARQGPTKQ